MAIIAYILISVFLVSIISFVAVLALYFGKKIERLLNYLVSFAAGGMLGAAFLDLFPEATKEPADNIYVIALAGILIFFLIESYFHWHHHHAGTKGRDRHMHAVGYMNLFGDGLHNFIDGLIIAASYLVSVPLGLITTIAVIAHEIPQEFGDFGILLYSGFTKPRALLYNFLTALTAFAGALLAYFSSGITTFNHFLIPFAAGSFIYIAVADLLPELHKHQGKKTVESLAQIILLFAGIALIWLVGKIFS